jgi:catechol 2,3-dioxygenase
MNPMNTITDSTTHPVAEQSRRGVLPAAAELGVVHLTVRNLDRSVSFYRRALGLVELDRAGRTVWVGAGDAPLLALHEDPGAVTPGRTAGLYHVALLYPDRIELSRVARRLAVSRTPIQGASDHGTHEAIYLADPDGNGVELAVDRDRSRWPDLANIDSIRPRALDLDGLLALTAEEPVIETAKSGTRVGHIHLHLGDLDDGLAFYRDLIGFEAQTLIPGQAAFVSAGGYHHHLAFNLWNGAGVAPQAPGGVGLRHWTIVVSDASDVAAVRGRIDAADTPTADVEHGFSVEDPGGITVHVVTPEGNH